MENMDIDKYFATLQNLTNQEKGMLLIGIITLLYGLVTLWQNIRKIIQLIKPHKADNH